MTFFKKHKNHAEPYKAVFSVSIDTNHEYSNNTNNTQKSLVPLGEYWFGKKERHATYEDIQEFAINVINNELRDECEQFIDIPIFEIKVRGTYEGSIELFFTVLFGVIAGVTGVKDLYDSIDFLRTLAEKKLQKRLKEKYGELFRIDVRRQIPCNTKYDFETIHKRHAIPARPKFSDEHPKRDGFFYYLLISNVVLLAIVILLVFRAVVKVYF